jgi:DNA-binding NarL/FixJ family response regulator
MQTQSGCTEAIVYVWSLHPVAARCLMDAVAAESARVFMTRMLAASEESLSSPQTSGELLILDGCCQVDWQRLAMRWQKGGGKVLVLLPADTTNSGKELRALFFGVRGVVVTSSCWQSELNQAVNTVLDGGLWISREVLSEYVKRTSSHNGGRARGADPLEHLTAREEQIMSFLLKRDSNKEIGNVLGISERTVKYHVSNILQKKQVSSRKELLERVDAFTDISSLPGWKQTSMGIRG